MPKIAFFLLAGTIRRVDREEFIGQAACTFHPHTNLHLKPRSTVPTRSRPTTPLHSSTVTIPAEAAAPPTVSLAIVGSTAAAGETGAALDLHEDVSASPKASPALDIHANTSAALQAGAASNVHSSSSGNRHIGEEDQMTMIYLRNLGLLQMTRKNNKLQPFS